MSDSSVYGLIGLTEESVGLDRRIYTGLTTTDPTLAVSYNSGRVDVFLNGVKLVGNHSEMPSGTRDYTFTATGQGSSITLATGVALVSSDVVELMGYVSNSANTVTTYNYTASDGDTAFTANNSSGDLVNVFLNGVLLDSSDYNLTTANTVTLGSGAAASDIVHIQVIGALDHSNFVPESGGTFSGNVAVNGDVTIPDKIIHSGDTDTFTSFGTDSYAIHLGGTQAVQFLYNNIYIKENNKGIIGYKTGGSALELIKVGSNDKVQIGEGSNDILLNTSGNVEIASGNLVIGTAGQGITFQSAGGTGTSNTANSLNDYETGSFTATCLNSVTLHSGLNLCSYTKIGELVTVRGQVRIDSTNSGQAFVINNLPFTSKANIGDNSNYSVGAVRLYQYNLESNILYAICQSDANSSTLQFIGVRDDLSSTALAADQNAYVMFSISYTAS